MSAAPSAGGCPAGWRVPRNGGMVSEAARGAPPGRAVNPSPGGVAPTVRQARGPAGTRRAARAEPEDVVMKQNVGSLDRIVRIVVGLGLVSLAFVGPRTPWGWVGLVPLLTAFVGVCPLYLPFRISTCGKP
jgi:hypothetical protein